MPLLQRCFVNNHNVTSAVALIEEGKFWPHHNIICHTIYSTHWTQVCDVYANLSTPLSLVGYDVIEYDSTKVLQKHHLN